MGFRAVVVESRSRCSYKGGYLVVTRGDKTAKLHLSEISSLTLCTTQVYVSAYLLSELAKCKIPVVFSDEKCFPVAESLPLYGAHNCSGRVADQLEWTLPSKKRVWKKVVTDKIGAQADVLDYVGCGCEAEILRGYGSEVKSGDTTNREAAAAALYFKALFGRDFNRDQDTDLNASLNYGYSILLSRVCREVVSRGYLTQQGIGHRGELNQWNLACDLMEPFRPFVDLSVAHSGIDCFSKEMRHMLLDMMSREVSWRDGRYKLGSVISSYVKECLNALNKEAPADDIEMYVIA